MRKQRAFTIIEVLLASSMFVLVTGVIFFALRQSTQVFTQVDGNFDALAQLRRASSRVPVDVEKINPNNFATKRVTTGSGGHGNAIWMLSAVNDMGEYIRDDFGRPVYQKNILYYLVRPNNHSSISDGVNCTIDDAAHPNGDPFCPHKILIRKEIRNSAAGADELLLSAGQVDAYLTLPDGYDLSGMNSEVAPVAGSPGVYPNTLRVVAASMLSFEIDQSTPPFVRLIFRAVRINESRKEIPAFGAVDLTVLPQTLEISNSVRPKG